MDMLYIESKTNDPYYNLALEEYMFHNSTEDCFMLWQNDKTIVIGKYQNTIEEISSRFVKENNINVVRRLSGGGAVYHDMGNVNFTFIAKRSEENSFCFEHFTGHIIDILKEFKITAEFNSRNDLTIGGRKFSGNSQYIKGDRILHHGTLLFDSDLEVLVKALNVSDAKIESKAVKSVHERVTNIKSHMEEDISLKDFKIAIKKHICGGETIKKYFLSREEEKDIYYLRRDKYITWNWNYGESPKCNIIKRGRYDGGLVQIMMTVENGTIQVAKIYGDFFAGENLQEVAEQLEGCRYTMEGIEKQAEEISKIIVGLDKDWLINLIL